MAKLYFRILFISLIATITYGQDSLCVFKMKGTAYLKLAASMEPLKKGRFLNPSATVMLPSSADITAIDASGKAYQLTASGEYGYDQVLKHRVIEKQHSLTTKYLKVIWDELLNKSEEKTIIGGVFRGDIPMLFPKDSSSIVKGKIEFTWQPNEEGGPSYFFLRNKKTNDLFKIETNGSTLGLYKDLPILQSGSEFEWMVSSNPFPNLKNSLFFGFNLIDRETYESRLEAYQELIADLKTIGLTEKEITNTLCTTYGLCK